MVVEDDVYLREEIMLTFQRKGYSVSGLSLIHISGSSGLGGGLPSDGGFASRRGESRGGSSGRGWPVCGMPADGSVKAFPSEKFRDFLRIYFKARCKVRLLKSPAKL